MWGNEQYGLTDWSATIATRKYFGNKLNPMDMGTNRWYVGPDYRYFSSAMGRVTFEDSRDIRSVRNKAYAIL